MSYFVTLFFYQFRFGHSVRLFQYDLYWIHRNENEDIPGRVYGWAERGRYPPPSPLNFLGNALPLKQNRLVDKVELQLFDDSLNNIEQNFNEQIVGVKKFDTSSSRKNEAIVSQYYNGSSL